MTPNPAFRVRQSLDGPWDFRFGDEEGWRTVPVPSPWQASCPDLRNSFGTGRYRRRVGPFAAWAGGPMLGRGRLVATTFRLTEDPPGQDPVVATPMRALIETAGR